MLINGKEKLERMRDGRAIYIGAERVDDVTRHPAFRNGAQTIAGLYDLKADPAKRDLFTFEEGGERYGLPWLRCRNRDDLARRMRAMKAIADATYGLIGRSPDHVAGLVSGLAMKPALLDGLTPGFGANLIRYYELAAGTISISRSRSRRRPASAPARSSPARRATTRPCRWSARTTAASSSPA
jgi:4-hydroxyphenylacetate 3-monooxygenase